MQQTMIQCENNYESLDVFFQAFAGKAILLVHDSSLAFLKIKTYFETLERRLKVSVVPFQDFQPNPLYESVVAGVSLFREKNCQGIIAVGGGSAMDVAKCIKLYATMSPDRSYLQQEIVPNKIPLAAVPTTAGTGSEATRYAVIYAKGEKQSITHESCIPQVVIFDPSVLETLPLYQKKATMLDALCHAVESAWSVNATDESLVLSRQALELLLQSKNAYLANERQGNTGMQMAANLAGKAINITQTTAGHAMCYKLTSLFHIAHGHAAALCVAQLWPYMIHHREECIDERGEGYLNEIFRELSRCFGGTGIEEGARQFQALLAELDFAPLHMTDPAQLEELVKSVNLVRLKNNPIPLSQETLFEMYKNILNIQ